MTGDKVAKQLERDIAAFKAGFTAGYQAAKSKLIRCGECEKFVVEEDETYCMDGYGQCDENGFCAWAKKRMDEC